MPNRDELIEIGSDLAYVAFVQHVSRETDEFRQPGFFMSRQAVRETLKGKKFSDPEIDESIEIGIEMVRDLVQQERTIAIEEELSA